MQRSVEDDAFAPSRARFEEVVGFLDGDGASALSHSELEDCLDREGRELVRLLLQDHLDLRAAREQRSRFRGDIGAVGWPMGTHDLCLSRIDDLVRVAGVCRIRRGGSGRRAPGGRGGRSGATSGAGAERILVR
jgi:hypothetical protein